MPYIKPPTIHRLVQVFTLLQSSRDRVLNFECHAQSHFNFYSWITSHHVKNSSLKGELETIQLCWFSAPALITWGICNSTCWWAICHSYNIRYSYFIQLLSWARRNLNWIIRRKFLPNRKLKHHDDLQKAERIVWIIYIQQQISCPECCLMLLFELAHFCCSFFPHIFVSTSSKNRAFNCLKLFEKSSPKELSWIFIYLHQMLAHHKSLLVSIELNFNSESKSVWEAQQSQPAI